MESHRVIESPLGPILLSSDALGRLTGVGLQSHDLQYHDDAPGRLGGRGLDEVAAQLGEYFAGRRTRFDVPLAVKGTSFQRQVWAHLRQIPFGATVSYGQLAARLGRPGAARAVGRANATNPIAIIVPCHRVIASSGDLTGYGGGLEAKQHLLDLEAGAPGPGPTVGATVARRGNSTK